MAQEKRENILYPSKGLSENYGFSYQMELTSRDERNMRSIDPITGRARGAQRAGLGLYTGNTELNGTAKKVQAMASVSQPKNQLDWSPAVANIHSATLPADEYHSIAGGVLDMATDPYGAVYVLSRFGYVFKYSRDLGLTDTIPLGSAIKTGAGKGLVCCIAVDAYQNIFIGEGNPVSGAIDASKGCVHAFELQADDTYAHSWTIDTGLFVNDIAFYAGDLVLAVSEKSGDAQISFAATAVGLRIYPDYDVTGIVAPTENTVLAWTNTDYASGVAEDYDFSRVQRLAIRDDGAIYMSVGLIKDDGAVTACTQGLGYLYKLEPYTNWNSGAAAPTWSLINDRGATDVSGFGIGLALGLKNDNDQQMIYTTGERMSVDVSASGYAANIRCMIDKGSTLDTAGAGTWLVNFGNTSRGFGLGVGNHIYNQRLSVDDKGTLYVPYSIRDDSNSSFSGSVDASVIAVNKTGQTAVSNSGLGAITDTTCLPTQSPSGIGTNIQGGLRAVSVFGDQPEYGTLGDSEDIQVTDTLICGGNQAAGPNAAPYPQAPSLWKTQIVAPTQEALSPRTITVLAAANGLFKTVTSSGFVALDTTSPLTATYDATSPYVQMVAAFSKVFITDGKSYHVYDPKTNARTNWISNDLGAIPPRCRIVETWRGRLVLGRDPEDPSAWHMSKVFDPHGWDNFPQNPSAQDAISARNSRAGGIPDVVNAIIPYNDDLCIIGGDSSVWRMTGDPRAGGQIDLITDQAGISFGRPWCKDPAGRVWFFGSHGSLYVMSPGGIENMSKGKVARALQNIDLGANYINMVWDHIDEGVHIFVCPFGAGGSVMLDHWFYDATNGGFHKDRFGIVAADKIQPTSAIDLNGDSFDDRAVLIGCEDGRARRWGTDNSGAIPVDDEQTSTVDIAIDSYFTAGPLFPPSMTGAAQVSEFSALLGDAQDGCNFELFSSDNPEVLGAAKATGTLTAGRNLRKTVRVSGNSLFLRMRNAMAGQRWAYEMASANVAGAGLKRTQG